MAFLSARAPPSASIIQQSVRTPPGIMPNTIVGLSDLLNKIPSPAPRPDTILGGGPDVDTKDPIELLTPRLDDRILRDKDKYTWGRPDLWGV
jgi:hypothetical protein